MKHKIPLAKPAWDDEMKEAAQLALQNEHFVLGESVHKFEEEFATYCGTKFAISTASGTSALVLSMLAANLRGRSVITTPMSFVASANSIVHAGARPTFADISVQGYTIDPERVRASLTDDTKALLPVHLYGYPADMNELRAIASERGILVIEDACQAHGASLGGVKVGCLGDIGCFSFYPSKNMTVGGDGGMVVTNDQRIAESVSSLRDCGRAKGKKYLHTSLGYTERLNTVQAAIGRVQLRRLNAWNEARRRIASRYDQGLANLRQMTTPPHCPSSVVPVFHLYVARCTHRDELRTWLANAGVATGIHYELPIHLQPIYRDMFHYVGGEFPNSEKLCREVVSLPIYPDLSMDEVEYVCQKIREFCHGLDLNK